MKTVILKTIFIVPIIIILFYFFSSIYPLFSNYMRSSALEEHMLEYSPKNISISKIDDNSIQISAQAVPILMYHGITEKPDKENTDRDHFISQMEILKRNGYQTISLDDFYLFKQGRFTLPSKPIIITFDDGRKDSYYPVDEILKKLGFKAVIFVVSGKANDNDKFFLSWAELKAMKESGRWDVQAHGTYSHTKIIIDEKGTVGRFLSSRRYDQSIGLESISDYEDRVESDFVKNIDDIKKELGVLPRYYAIPLNDFGQRPASNYGDAVSFNNTLIKKYFDLSFIQVNDSENVNNYHASIYNFKDGNSYLIGRIEVKNMSDDDLLNKLKSDEPRTPKIYIDADNYGTFDDIQQLDYVASVSSEIDGLHIKASREIPSSRVLFGEKYWRDYTVEVDIQKLYGKSVSLIAYLEDKNTYLSFGLSDGSVFARRYVNGVEFELLPIQHPKINKMNTYKLIFNNGTVAGFFNGSKIFQNTNIGISRGNIGIKIWDPTVVKRLDVYPSN